jgi:hypothetical protein
VGGRERVEGGGVKIKMVTDGTLPGSKFVDAKTRDEIKNVKCTNWRFDGLRKVMTATIQLEGKDIEGFVGELSV